MKDSIFHIISYFINNIRKESPKITFWKWILNPVEADEKNASMEKTWNNITVSSKEDLSGSWKEVQRKAGIQRKHEINFLIRKASRIAAIFIFCALIVAGVKGYMDNYKQSIGMLECSVPAGSYKRILLSDGTAVTLNSGSFLIYPKKFMTATREVYLTGEGNFVVHKDKKHPFIVKTPIMAVRALGTVFNVKAYESTGKTTAVLLSGSIEVSDMLDRSKSVILKPSEQLEIDNMSHKFCKSTVNSDAVTGWTRGELNFINVSVKEIMLMVERHYNIKIKADPIFLNSSDLYDIKIRPDETLRRTMKIISETVGGMSVVYEKNNDISLVSSNASVKVKGGEN